MKAGDGTEGTSDVTESEDGEATLRLSTNPQQIPESHRDMWKSSISHGGCKRLLEVTSGILLLKPRQTSKLNLLTEDFSSSCFIQLFLSIWWFIGDAHHDTLFAGLRTNPDPEAPQHPLLLHCTKYTPCFPRISLSKSRIHPSIKTLQLRELFHHACHFSKP